MVTDACKNAKNVNVNIFVILECVKQKKAL